VEPEDKVARGLVEGEKGRKNMAGMAMYMQAMLAPLGFLWWCDEERGQGDRVE
jgi:hypothetical protein